MIGNKKKKKFDVNENAKVQLIFWSCWENAFSLIIVKYRRCTDKWFLSKEIIHILHFVSQYVQTTTTTKNEREMKQMCRWGFTERNKFATIPTTQRLTFDSQSRNFNIPSTLTRYFQIKLLFLFLFSRSFAFFSHIGICSVSFHFQSSNRKEIFQCAQLVTHTHQYVTNSKRRRRKKSPRRIILLSLNKKKHTHTHEPEKKKFALYIHPHHWNFFFFVFAFYILYSCLPFFPLT